MFEGTLKLRYVVALTLCLLLFVAAIDQIPDPPAVNPHNQETICVSVLHAGGSSAVQQEILISFVPSHVVRTSSSSSGLTVENRILGLYQLLLVRPATDSSPPLFS
jgi:hypothetical protein